MSTNDRPVYVTYDGDTQWLRCFAQDPDGERGHIVRSIQEGDSWSDLATAVEAHQCPQEQR